MAVFETLSAVGAVLGLVLLAGLIAGQFRKGVVAELRSSLTTANTELDIERKRSDRLEKAVQHNEELLRGMEVRLAALEAENKVLKETLQSGIKLAPEFTRVMSEMLRVHEEKSAQMMRDNAEIVAARVALVNQERSTDLNKRFDEFLKAVQP